MKISNLLATSGLAAFALIACGGSDDTSATTSTTSTATTATTGQGGATATVGQGGATATTGQGGGGGGGDPEPMLNGCTRATAKDLTVQMKSVTITDISDWTLEHKACIIVMPGTQVVWQGNFVNHPLAGGPAGKADLASPISLAKPSGGAVTVIIPTVNGNGQAYPYFCTNHNGMQGVVYTSELP